MSKPKQRALTKPEPLTREEWLSELESISAQAANADGLTTADICERTGRCSLWVRKAIGRAIKAGLWEMAGRKRGSAIDGRPTYAPAYRPVKGGRR